MTQRTDQERKATEVYCRKVAEVLNDGGFDLSAILAKKHIPVSCTQENIKENVFKAIVKAMFPPKISTTELTSSELSETYEVMSKWLGTEFGVHIEWPSEESLSEEQRDV